MSEMEKTTRESILIAAREEFLERGYRSAGLRDIARKAGVTTGALYGYFRNKEELFEALVDQEYETIMGLYRQALEEFARIPPERQLEEMMPLTGRAMRQMAEYMYENRDAFKLMLCRAEGTKYSDLIHQMAEMDVQATHDFAASTSQNGTELKPVNTNLEHMLTSGMFAAFFELIIHDVPREEAEEYLQQMLEFYTAGWFRLMGL